MVQLIRLAVAGVVALACLSAAQPASSDPVVTYYVALGDSLSQGYMPGRGDTEQGYVDDLYATLHARNRSLQLVKLGCSGETTTTMRTGGVCPYAAGSQLAAAEQFLRAHHGFVRYVTIDIGANDVDACASTGTIDPACVADGLGTIAANLPAILSGLRQAGGYSERVAAMTYYDPFVAAWLLGPDGQATARNSVATTNTLNGLESADYAAAKVRIADAAAAFRTNDFTDTTTLPGFGAVPVNVATICTLTYMCTLQNIHANAAGYQTIADTFARVLPGIARVTGQ